MNNSEARVKKVFDCWMQDRISTQAAALAYYTIFSLAPIILICISIIGIVYGKEAAQGQILAQIKGLIGTEAARQVQEIIVGANKPITAWWARITSVIVLLFSASGVFSEIQTGLNLIWGVKANPNKGWLGIVKARFFSFVMVFGVAFLLLVSLIISALISLFSSYLNPFIGNNILIDSCYARSILSCHIFKLLPSNLVRSKNQFVLNSKVI
ncbi:YihY/virulence factor BrkB family protein [Legionella sp. km772]|uniref:YihY/virulence factor BrkB family protein n=1 Tax=Legionella sp. km772 TaxID=2498111 RepID=UPI000F8EDA93|nr:YihY/virulence factor BrkB family protein [Legionella sp. km772]RUR06449.1 YihY/virulence factor BrkB family protein [Legionella sp. km772]